MLLIYKKGPNRQNQIFLTNPNQRILISSKVGFFLDNNRMWLFIFNGGTRVFRSVKLKQSKWREIGCPRRRSLIIPSSLRWHLIISPFWMSYFQFHVCLLLGSSKPQFSPLTAPLTHSNKIYWLSRRRWRWMQWIKHQELVGKYWKLKRVSEETR